jgi:flagellar biosynthesis/type III secretory pathway ATPase
MMDTKWNETIKSINKKENFKSNITNNDVLILENKLKKINQKKINQKKTLTKLPLLENIYESFETKEGMENNVEVFTKSTPLLVPHNKIGEIYLKSNIAISYTIKINSVQANDIHENQLLCIIKDTNGVFNSENLQQSIGIFSKIIKNNGKTYIDFFYVKDGSIEKLTSENDVELENNANIK